MFIKEPIRNTLNDHRDAPSGRKKNRNTFYTEIIKQIRKGKSDILFTKEQLQELKARFPEENILHEYKDDYIEVRLG